MDTAADTAEAEESVVARTAEVEEDMEVVLTAADLTVSGLSQFSHQFRSSDWLNLRTKNRNFVNFCSQLTKC